MKDTIIYLIRHAETVNENGIRNTNEDSQMINEKEILSVYGEEQSRKLSENIELNNIDVIWSSSYTRAKATAKYIANSNKLPINLIIWSSAPLSLVNILWTIKLSKASCLPYPISCGIAEASNRI